jgi:hypothetical protein
VRGFFVWDPFRGHRHPLARLAGIPRSGSSSCVRGGKRRRSPSTGAIAAPPPGQHSGSAASTFTGAFGSNAERPVPTPRPRTRAGDVPPASAAGCT